MSPELSRIARRYRDRPNRALVHQGKKWKFRCVLDMGLDRQRLDRFCVFRPMGRWSVHDEKVGDAQKTAFYFERLHDLVEFRLVVT